MPLTVVEFRRMLKMFGLKDQVLFLIGVHTSIPMKDLNYNPKENPKEWIESNPDVFCNPNLHPELPEWSKKNFPLGS